MAATIPPIASGHRGSRKKTTLEEYVPLFNQLRTSNARCNNNNVFGRTTRVATNLRSYFTPSDPDHVDEHPNNDQDHQLHRQRRASAHECHSHWGSRWAESKATCRFRAQSVQFDTGTSSFQKRAGPLASQLILVINNKCRTTQIRNNWSKLAVSAFQITQYDQAAQLRSHNKLGIF